MILTRTPFRVSFAGGGSDLQEFYRRSPGAVLSCTIDKAMYIAVHPYFHDKIRIKYSRTEDVASAAEVEHPLVRECLNLVGIERGMEIAVLRMCRGNRHGIEQCVHRGIIARALGAVGPKTWRSGIGYSGVRN